MGQYDITKLVFEADGITVEELIRKTGVVESSCRNCLIKLQSKDIVAQEGRHYYQHPEADESDLERIRPRTLSEIRDE